MFLYVTRMSGSGSAHTRSVVTDDVFASMSCTRLKQSLPPGLAGKAFTPASAISRAFTKSSSPCTTPASWYCAIAYSSCFAWAFANTERAAQQKANGELQPLRDQRGDELGATPPLQQVSLRLIHREDRLEDLLAEILDAAL